MSVAILDVGQTAVVLAGGVFVFTDGLGEGGVASLVFRVNRDIVGPLAPINGGHGQRYKEGVAGAGDHFGNASLHNEVQALLQARSGSMAGGIRLGHSHAAVLHGSFQSVLDSGGIGSQCGGQFVVQSIRRVVVDTTLSLVGICGGQADSGQHSAGAVTAVEAIQHPHMPLTIHDLVVHGNVSDAKVGELHTLDGVFAQFVDNSVVMQAGGNIGFCVPHAVLAGLGNVIFINVQGCFLRRINGRLGKCRSNEAQGHNGGHQQRQYAMDLFHVQFFSFINSDFLQK